MNRVPAWLAFVLPLTLYATTLPPGVLFWDPAEMQTVPAILGIAHPNGFPAFVLAGWAYVHVVPFGSVAWRMSLFGALAMAAAARAAYGLCVALDLEPPAALGGALVFATGFVAWSRGTRPEVHALALALLGASLVCAVRFRRGGRFLDAALAAGSYGAALATHGATLLAAPGLILIVARPRARFGARGAAACGALFTLPLFCYLYLPLRSAYVTAHRFDPTLALGIPPGRPFWDYDHPATLSGFVRLVTAADFHPNGFPAALLQPQAWFSLRSIVAPAFLAELGAVGLALAAVGCFVVARRRSWDVAGLFLAVAPSAALAVAFADEADTLRYLLPAFWLLAVLGACGAQVLFGRWSAVALFALAGVLVVGNRHISDQRTDTGWPLYVDRVRAATPPNAIVVAEWPLATPLAYAAYVEHSFGDRIVDAALPQDEARRIDAWSRSRAVFIVGSPTLHLPHLRLDVVDAGVPAILRVEAAGT